MYTGEEGGRKMSHEEMEMVKNLVEQCLEHHMSQNQVMDILFQKEKIEPSVTKTVWQELEKQNQEFFEQYHLRVKLKEQIKQSNDRLLKLVEPNVVVSTSVSTGSHIPSTPLEIDRHRLGTLGLQLTSTGEMEVVKNLIEQCLMHYMSKEMVMDILLQRERIEPSLTHNVWQELEKQNQEFFEAYHLRLMLAEQIKEYNSLLVRQAELMNVDHQEDPNGVTSPLTSLEINRHQHGTLGLQLNPTGEVNTVKNLIEQCLSLYMSKIQVMDFLYQQEQIEPSLTLTVWRDLEKQNKEFFKYYHLRLILIEQIKQFNDQVNPNRVASPSVASGSHIPSTSLEIDRHRLGTVGLKLQAQPDHSSPPAPAYDKQ